MHLAFVLKIITLVLSVLLIATVLVQQQGSSLGGAFGGGSAVYRTRRGAERFLFRATIVLAILYVLSALANILIK
jgi:protein translocase SecG subunit